jgi:hypothetical protein
LCYNKDIANNEEILNMAKVICFQDEELRRLIDDYFNEVDEAGDIPTIAGAADKLGLVSSDIRNIKPDNPCYDEFKRIINKVSIIAEKNMLLRHGDKWLNINEGLVPVVKQEVTNVGGLTIDINSDVKHNL